MDDARVGAAIRALRLRRGWRQSDLAALARVSTTSVSRAERGHLANCSVALLRQLGAPLDLRLEWQPRWRGGELARLLDQRHAALAETVTRALLALGWVVRPEVSFAHFGERGSVDLVARHADGGALLLIELKSTLLDLQATLTSIHRKERLAQVISGSLGWQSPATASCALIVADGRTNRRRAAEYRAVLHAALPSDGRRLRAWLRRPIGSIWALAFWPVSHPGNARRGTARPALGAERQKRIPRA